MTDVLDASALLAFIQGEPGGQSGSEVDNMTMMGQHNDLRLLTEYGQNAERRQCALVVEGLQNVVTDER